MTKTGNVTDSRRLDVPQGVSGGIILFPRGFSELDPLFSLLKPSLRNVTKGFTLIELLIVIAVIAILAALLLPALSAAKLKAYQVTCLNNTRELAQMALLYQEDYGRGLPRELDGASSWFAHFGVLPSGRADFRICPVAAKPLQILFPEGGRWGLTPGTADSCWDVAHYFLNYNGPVSGPGNLQRDAVGSYAANYWFESGGGGTAISYPIGSPGVFGLGKFGAPGNPGFPTADSVRHPATTPLFADSTWMIVAPSNGDLPAGDLFRSKGTTGYAALPMGALTIARHGSRFPTPANSAHRLGQPLPRDWGVNVSFDDGHAELVKLPDLWTLTWNRTWVPQGQPGPLH